MHSAATAAHADLDVWPAWIGEHHVPELDVGALWAPPGLGLACRHHLGVPVQQGKNPCAGTYCLHSTKHRYILMPSGVMLHVAVV